MVYDNDLELPFETHVVPGSSEHPPQGLVFSTEPAWADDHPAYDIEDRQQCDVVATLYANQGDEDGSGVSDVVEFLADALNAYVSTPHGLKHWKRVRKYIVARPSRLTPPA